MTDCKQFSTIRRKIEEIQGFFYFRFFKYAARNAPVITAAAASLTAPAYHRFSAPKITGTTDNDTTGKSNPLPTEIGNDRDAFSIEVKNAASTTLSPISTNAREYLRRAITLLSNNRLSRLINNPTMPLPKI